MAVDEKIFPKGCLLAYDDKGELSLAAKILIEKLRKDDWEGKGVEHPCYGCRISDCEVRVVKYHDEENRYIKPPKIWRGI